MFSPTTPVRFGEPVDSVTPKRRVWRWLAVGTVVILGALMLYSAFTNPNFQWNIVLKYFTSEQVLLGLLRTIELTVIAMVLGTLLGAVLAMMRLSPVAILRAAAALYVWVFRATPLLVQLIILYNISALYPDIAIGLPFGAAYSVDVNAFLTPYLVAIVAFSLNEAAYMCEIIRGGVLSVDTGQSEAAKALGMRGGMIKLRIVFPQAMRFIIPPTGSQVISMLKGTSIISVIAFSELLYTVQVIYSRTFETIPLLIVAALWYLIVTSVLMVGQSFIEKYYSRGHARTGGSTGRSARAKVPSVVPVTPERKLS